MLMMPNYVVQNVMFQPNAVYNEGFLKRQKIIQSLTAAVQVNVIILLSFHLTGLVSLNHLQIK